MEAGTRTDPLKSSRGHKSVTSAANKHSHGTYMLHDIKSFSLREGGGEGAGIIKGEQSEPWVVEGIPIACLL